MTPAHTRLLTQRHRAETRRCSHHHPRCRRRPALAFTVVLSLACLLDASSGWALTRLPLCTALALTAPDVVQGAWSAGTW
jgi:hypothetical protein